MAAPAVTPSPIADRDRDKFADDVDRCPDDFGVMQGGCPIADRDDDRVLDPDDRCLVVPETRNGYQDDDGCPDELPADLAQVVGVVVGVEFELDREVLTPASSPALDHIALVLLRYPALRFEVSGHSDRPACEYSKCLSARRADAVRRYLIGRGVPAAQLEARGVGDEEPIATNKTAAGRKQNRRIELAIVHD